MKSLRFFFFMALSLMILSGCNRTDPSVQNPPEFVEMYLQSPTNELAFKTSFYASDLPILNLEYDAVLDSESDFEVVVVTNGINYDLLYSVELNDSLLGNCVYTDQSTLYAASSTIIVENDGTYTTKVVLTIPGSTEHTTFLSERTISLTKILFTRDTANGTFPADIPENSTTSLLFEIHAIHYFDETLGLPLSVSNGKVDVILTPDSPYFVQAQTLGMTTLTIPALINDYPIGTVVLQDLPWVTEISILGASEDVYVLGDFEALTSLTLDGLNFVSLFEFRDITINGIFPALTVFSLSNSMGYRFFLAHNFVTDDEFYLDYVETSGDFLYDFAVLETIEIVECRLEPFQVGSDNYDLAFPALTTLTVVDSYIGNFDFGEEANAFPKLEEVFLENTFLSSAQFAGNKVPSEAPAALILSGLTMDNTLLVKGSLFSTISFIDSTINGVRIEGGTVYDSVFSGISFTNTVFPANGGTFFLYGSHPALVDLNLTDVAIYQIKIGDVGSEFESLTNITLSGITGWSINIGERDVAFPALEHLVLDQIDLGWNLYVGGETSLYPSLQDITLTTIEANNLQIGYFGGEFDQLTLLTMENVIITGSLTISGGQYPLLDTIVMVHVSSGAVNLSPTSATYDLYLDDFTASSAFSLYVPGCQKIYLSDVDVTTWAYYDYADGLEIPMETGTYSPAV